jgi:hypothetical protein
MPEGDALRARLSAAVESGESIRIIYQRVSQPGSVREVRPIAIRGETLRAHDVAAGIEKHFLLSNIQIADAQVTAPSYDALASTPGEDSRTIQEFFAPRIPELEALGWHVSLSRDELSLHRFFKNGKPRKGAEVRIVCEPEPPPDDDTNDDASILVSISLGGVAISREEQESSPRRWRAYSVRCASLPAARRFANLSRATALVLAEARALAPRNAS